MRLLILLLLLLSCNSPKTENDTPVKTYKATANSTPKEDSTEATHKTVPISIDTPQIVVKGTRTLNSVVNETKRHLISVNYWYQRNTSLNKNRAVIIVGFSINELGVPSDITLLNTSLEASEFVQKVVKDIEKWRFAKMYDGAGITEVIYPIILEPSKPLQL